MTESDNKTLDLTEKKVWVDPVCVAIEIEEETLAGIGGAADFGLS